MSTRIRYYMTWVIAPVTSFAGAPFSSLDDFYNLARTHLCTRFADRGAELKIAVRDNHGTSAILDLIWDLDLINPTLPGQGPEDYAKIAHTELVDHILGYGHTLIVDIYREVDFKDVQDHAEMMTIAHVNNISLVSDDYPVFRPEQHPDWPEADVAFSARRHMVVVRL